MFQILLISAFVMCYWQILVIEYNDRFSLSAQEMPQNVYTDSSRTEKPVKRDSKFQKFNNPLQRDISPKISMVNSRKVKNAQDKFSHIENQVNRLYSSLTNSDSSALQAKEKRTKLHFEPKKKPSPSFFANSSLMSDRKSLKGLFIDLRSVLQQLKNLVIQCSGQLKQILSITPKQQPLLTEVLSPNRFNFVIGIPPNAGRRVRDNLSEQMMFQQCEHQSEQFPVPDQDSFFTISSARLEPKVTKVRSVLNRSLLPERKRVSQRFEKFNSTLKFIKQLSDKSLSNYRGS